MVKKGALAIDYGVMPLKVYGGLTTCLRSRTKTCPTEIYLSDIRKADPAKWKTIIRQPMQ